MKYNYHETMTTAQLRALARGFLPDYVLTAHPPSFEFTKRETRPNYWEGRGTFYFPEGRLPHQCGMRVLSEPMDGIHENIQWLRNEHAKAFLVQAFLHAVKTAFSNGYIAFVVMTVSREAPLLSWLVKECEIPKICSGLNRNSRNQVGMYIIPRMKRTGERDRAVFHYHAK